LYRTLTKRRQTPLSPVVVVEIGETSLFCCEFCAKWKYPRQTSTAAGHHLQRFAALRLRAGTGSLALNVSLQALQSGNFRGMLIAQLIFSSN
jgi:hypothetical protein